MNPHITMYSKYLNLQDKRKTSNKMSFFKCYIGKSNNESIMKKVNNAEISVNDKITDFDSSLFYYSNIRKTKDEINFLSTTSRIDTSTPKKIQPKVNSKKERNISYVRMKTRNLKISEDKAITNYLHKTEKKHNTSPYRIRINNSSSSSNFKVEKMHRNSSMEELNKVLKQSINEPKRNHRNDAYINFGSKNNIYIDTNNDAISIEKSVSYRNQLMTNMIEHTLYDKLNSYCNTTTQEFHRNKLLPPLTDSPRNSYKEIKKDHHHVVSFEKIIPSKKTTKRSLKTRVETKPLIVDKISEFINNEEFKVPETIKTDIKELFDNQAVVKKNSSSTKKNLTKRSTFFNDYLKTTASMFRKGNTCLFGTKDSTQKSDYNFKYQNTLGNMSTQTRKLSVLSKPQSKKENDTLKKLTRQASSILPFTLNKRKSTNITINESIQVNTKSLNLDSKGKYEGKSKGLKDYLNQLKNQNNPFAQKSKNIIFKCNKINSQSRAIGTKIKKKTKKKQQNDDIKDFQDLDSLNLQEIISNIKNQPSRFKVYDIDSTKAETRAIRELKNLSKVINEEERLIALMKPELAYKMKDYIQAKMKITMDEDIFTSRNRKKQNNA